MEIWKDIPDYENFYQASNLGRIKSLSRQSGNHILKSKIIKPWINQNGYECISLCKVRIRFLIVLKKLVFIII